MYSSTISIIIIQIQLGVSTLFIVETMVERIYTMMSFTMVLPVDFTIRVEIYQPRPVHSIHDIAKLYWTNAVASLTTFIQQEVKH